MSKELATTDKAIESISTALAKLPRGLKPVRDWTKLTPEKYINDDGLVGVIVSPGYGAGWSSWNDGKMFLCMDRSLVQAKINGVKGSTIKAVFEGAGPDICVLGWDKAVVEWMPQGSVFKINEYDGFESIEFAESIDLMMA